MGIKRFVVDAKEEITVVYSLDDAIDREHEDTDVDKYQQTGDMAFLVLKDGVTPTEFVIHALTDKQERAAMTRSASHRDVRDKNSASMVGLANEAYAIGCTEIRNVERDGDSFKPKDLPLAGAVVREIGSHVLRVSGFFSAVMESKRAETDLGK